MVFLSTSCGIARSEVRDLYCSSFLGVLVCCLLLCTKAMRTGLLLQPALMGRNLAGYHIMYFRFANLRMVFESHTAVENGVYESGPTVLIV